MLRLHPYRYHRPRSLDEVLELLDEHEGDVMPIAGGTDLVPNMKHKLFTPGHLVGLKRVEELRGIERRDGEIVIGAGETLTSLATNTTIAENLPSLRRAASLIGHPMIRNTGTIGGNLCLDTRCTYYNQTYFWRKALGFCLKKDGDVCHVVPGGTRCVAAHSADTPPVLMTLDATVDLSSPRGSRSLTIADFFTADGIWNTVRDPDEIAIRIRVPLPPPALRTSFQKLRERKAVDFPLLNLALAVELEEDEETVRSIELVVAGLGAKPRRVGQLDRIAVGERLSPELIEEVGQQAYRQCNPLDNLIVEIEWRRAMVPVYVRRAFRDILARRAETG